MITRYLEAFLAVAFLAMGTHAQTGFFGQVTTRPEAGDLAPEVSIEPVLGTPQRTTWNPANLFGPITVLTFLPNISFNLQSVMSWNALIDEFVGKPVQFVCITQERESSLLPFLAEHPMKGFLLLDSGGAVGRSYGLGQPAAVIIGTDGRIIGFDRSIIPPTDTLKAVLEGRITTTPLKPGTAEFRAFIDSHKVLLDAQGPRLPKPDDYKPGFPPSYTVHISPSELENGRGNFGGDSWQNFRGYDLRDIISEVYSITPIRIELPASLDDSRQYDFSLVLPENESREEMYLRFQQAIQDYFYLSAARTTRLMDVYVVTAPDDRKPPAASQQSEGGGMQGFLIEFSLPARSTDNGSDLERLPKKVSLSALWNISGEGSLEAFCNTLERFLDRPVVNETNLQGQFEFRVAEDPGANGDFLVRLRNELGLAIEPARRNVQLQLLVFNPR